MARVDPQVLAHLEWLGFVQPTGLVVSAPALVRAGAILDRRDAEGQRLLAQCVEERADPTDDEPIPVIADFEQFARTVLSWSFNPKYYAGTADAPIPPELEVALPDYAETLQPDFAVRTRDADDGEPAWQLLVRTLEDGRDFDVQTREGGQLEASAHGRMERLLRDTGVPAGLLCNGHALRLISAPRGESSGWLDFPVAAMAQTAGRPICTALRLLLSEPRLLILPKQQRLTTLLEDSRKFQNDVSEQLAEQVLQALYELLRGFQAANDATSGELLREPLANDPDRIYRALLTVILRLVFLLYAEERDMLPEHETFVRYYSIAGLHERLRAHAAHFPDTMDQRYGAWAQLLVLFRMVYDGADAGDVRLPPRHGVLFDPDRFPFLEGRSSAGARQVHERIEPPLVPDGTVFRALEKLLVLHGERISYRALDVEQIGSVYETMMGFRLETATGRSVAVRASKRHGAPTTVNLEGLLAEEPGKRAKWLQGHADRKPPAKVSTAVKDAASLDELHHALAPIVDRAATPDLLPAGAMTLQPSEERRRSGSHYTPRALTEPIVRTTLEPVLARLRGEDGRPPRPDELLDLKVCDPAMGSGAFLVEACRQLGDALIQAWNVHGGRPEIPPDEDEVIFARRLIAQRCLYGVDRNPVAVDLAKMSLWLVTLAREHALTFVDHALRYGDSLVGLSRRQIQAFHLDQGAPPLAPVRIAKHLERGSELRLMIRDAADDVSDWALRDMWDETQAELEQVRLFGDLAVLAHFDASRSSDREAKRLEFVAAVADDDAARYRPVLDARRQASQPLVPFHWEVEFPEVFEGPAPGFNAFVGNPPFMAGKDISGQLGARYLDWLRVVWPDARGQVDLVAFFFRSAFDRLAEGGSMGLLATNTIRQGDTRAAGLRAICRSGGRIYSAVKRIPWQGTASVVTSAIFITKGPGCQPARLDGKPVDVITAFLVHRGGHDDPYRLAANSALAFSGYYYYGAGFTFDDRTPGASPLSRMHEILASSPTAASRIHPIIGGAELLSSPTMSTARYVIDFESMDEEAARAWPELMAVLEELVKPERQRCNRERLRHYWWQFGEIRPGLRRASVGKARLLMHPFTSSHLAFGFVPSDVYIASPHVAIVLEESASFAVLQSRCHEAWARFFGSSLKDDLRYTPSDCFETFPFPQAYRSSTALEAAGRAYYDFRARIMLEHDEGLTKTYNRFHDPGETSEGIVALRELHAAMDRAVLAAYGWSDVPTECEFLLDYEDEGEASTRRKKPWRCRWPDDVRDEVLARLVELNAARAAEEQRAGAGAKKQASTSKGPQHAAQAEGLF